MRLTLDSSEPLADVLRVLSGMYGVSVAVREPDVPADDDAPGTVQRRRPAARRGTRAERRPRRGRALGGPEPRTVREWAAASGMQVSSRGTLPAAVRQAYIDAHPS